MRRRIKGKKYKFIVNCIKSGNAFYFYIEAINLKNETYSFINNLNCILSEFCIEIDDKRTSESQWEVKKGEGRYFFDKSANFILDKQFRDYLEKQLDLDQILGGWNKK